MSSTTYSRDVTLPVSVDEAFAWHERPGALDRLIPPWEDVNISKRPKGVTDGVRVELRNRIGPFRMSWIVEHHDYQKNRQFRDTQIRGPFAHWEHLHSFRSTGPSASLLNDRIEYRIPGGPIGRLVARDFVQRKVDRMFVYRHRTTAADLSAHACHRDRGPQHVAITGSSGLVGSALIPFLTTGGHQTTRIVRRDVSAGAVAWRPARGEFDTAALEGVDAVVHLAGENIAGGRWDAARKQRIRESRASGTKLVCEGLSRMQRPPRVLVAASAVGFYGDRGDEVLDESSRRGDGFLAEVAEEWETATRPAADAGVRVVNLRFGMILSPRGGALGKMLTPFSLGAGGKVGTGQQYWSWLSIDDAVGAIHHAMMTDSLSGPVNAVSPEAVTNLEFTRTLGRVLSRPTLVPLPASAARLALGQMADELLLASTRARPTRLSDAGYAFREPGLESALRHLLGR